MVVGQMGAVQPQGIRKKKRLRYAPLVQEGAKRGVATQLVADAKEEQRYQEEKAFQEEQAAIAQKQWKKEFEMRKKQNLINNTMAGISTAIEVADFFF